LLPYQKLAERGSGCRPQRSGSVHPSA